jgi:pyrophosphatase PpaX
MVEMRLQRIKAIFFDLDGTLVDSSEAIMIAIENALKSKGLTHDKAKTAGMIGLPLEDIFKAITSDLSEAEIWQLVNEYRKYYLVHHLEGTTIHTSTRMVLRRLKERGFKLGVTTTKYREPVMDVLSHFSILELFDVVVTGYEVKRHKPAPDIVIEAAKRLGVNADQCVVVGDSPVDVQAGRRAGSCTIAVASDAKFKKQLESAKPTFVIEQLGDILSIL